MVQAKVRSHMVVVVGVDLSSVSKHVLARASDLMRSIDDAELHVVHVVEPQPIRRLLLEPVHPTGLGTRTDTESARRQLQAYCDVSVPQSHARVVLHTPVGHAADELTRIARETSADIIVVEVHEHARRMFHHAIVARLARTASCSVLAIRGPVSRERDWASRSKTASGP
jgi:nucleotide-binding universal stress UspA family protein